ncbi:MAG: hypothetical protein KAU48_09605 [Candidatus Thorarchaeota archaeon]|nr:hypothetical protein [Candidatus Thorarchaeota archaeon]
MTKSIPEQVKHRRHIDQIRTADHVKRFSGIERLMMGLKLSALAIRVAGERKDG